MSRRRILYAYWATVLGTAALAAIVAPLPFTGDQASAAAVIAAWLVCLIGVVLEPRGDRR